MFETSLIVKFWSRLLLVRLWRHLSHRRRRQAFLLLLLMIVSAAAEVVTLAAVLPFLGILTSPEHFYANSEVAAIAQIIGVQSPSQLLFPITLAFAIAAVFAGVIRMALLWVSTRLAFGTGADLSGDIYRRTLHQPYSVHISRNSSELISGITNKVATAVAVLNQVLLLISSLLLTIAITIALIFIDYRVALVACGVLGAIYWALSSISRRKLRQNGEKIASGQTQVVKALQDGLGGIRNVLLDGTQAIYCSVFDKASQQLRAAQGNNLFLAASPRFVIESSGMVLIAALAYSLSQKSGGISSALPTLGALALGAQRLLPALQQAYNSWATIRGSKASMIATIDLLDQPESNAISSSSAALFRFSDSIKFENVRFRYSHLGPWVLDGLNLEIRKGEKVAFVGTTGSGKSTALDLLMGLVEPEEGRFLVDGSPLSSWEDGRAWQRTIAHVPQAVFLTDASIAQNIALGIPPDKIQMDRVRRAAEQAQINGFIEAQDRGYGTLVGERGVRLSGGQRQRIGIARALYKDSEVLVLDEATSSLDNQTEYAVMEAIEGLGSHLTIILIAHRLSTVRSCDRIFELESGRVTAQGSYDELLLKSPRFRQMNALLS
jgi:ABC-type multidrug transport system fused ATPase/permease subunit